jgi:DNA mismatch repair protein MutS
VSRYEDQADYSAEVLATFEKFAQAEASDYRVTYRGSLQMDHVEAQVLEGVARLYPEVFGDLDDYCRRWRHFLHPTIAAFDREVQFYLAYLDFVDRMAKAGLEFCEPTISVSKEIEARNTFDVALANRLVGERSPVVRNDFWLRDRERILVVTGPNQGGKTTLARTLGQLHYLASLGMPVPGSAARVVIWDHLLTHFEKEEDLAVRTGKLEDELLRLRQIFEYATPKSIVILNEAFSSTSLKDATFLGRKVIQRLLDLDLVGVYVTFIDELSSLDEDPSIRTYKVVRKPADGLAYAMAIAQKYGLTYSRLRERLR